ncbi:MAG: L,D-transpeptidase family protein [Sphingomonas sp.]|uniref:L,D-transpeptidase family protein n=1 Tax=Sphingomonas sp. TaxID=28214 RepID=UPI0018566CF3|nr:L,D-transpeptidase family protein [Sphingomonas sp.]MBA3667827.1 L,D-transpeptidase family protein [Sphingomonas sp.]
MVGATPAYARKRPEPAPVAAPAPVVIRSYTPVDRFYSARKNAVLWMSNREAQVALIQLLRDAPIDGFARGPQLAGQIEAAIAGAPSGGAAAATIAERAMSTALIDYVQSLYAPIPGMTYGNKWVGPRTPSGESILAGAARAPSLPAYVQSVWNLNPVYGQLRQAALEEAKLPDGGQSARLALNLPRVRFQSPSNKFVLVDIASARLWMYENGVPVDTMKVVVGKNEVDPKSNGSLRTPMIASVMYYAIYNPYWHVPDHLVRLNIAPAAAKIGPGALKGNKYEVVDSWSANPIILDPKTIDWKAVAAGTAHALLRQKPTGGNSMGKMKFPFENGFGIYLHDTPHKEYFAKADRTLSNGCIRLERAADFGTWLMGRPARPEDTSAELTVPFPQGVPVYVTYLTARPETGQIAYAKDVYGWDSPSPTQAVALGGQ